MKSKKEDMLQRQCVQWFEDKVTKMGYDYHLVDNFDDFQKIINNYC